MKNLSRNLVKGLALLTLVSTVAFGAPLGSKPQLSTAAFAMPGPNPYPPPPAFNMPGPNPYPQDPPAMA